MRVLLATILFALASTSVFAQGNGNSGSAQSGGGIGALETRVAELEAQNIELQAAVVQLLSDLAAVGPHVAAYTDSDAIAAVDPTGVLDLLWRGFGNDANEVYLESANLHVTNGLGATETSNSLGNLIIGYNELRPRSPRLPQAILDDRSGSHMLVVGSENNYSSFGGIVAGKHNDVSGDFASVSGGSSNEASGDSSSVSGGRNGEASGLYSSVSGGLNNNASGSYSSVSGGYGNSASNTYTSVSGGQLNEASGWFSSASGGFRNIASGDLSSISGGGDAEASGYSSSISGGRYAEARGEFSSVSGGFRNEASGNYSVLP